MQTFVNSSGLIISALSKSNLKLPSKKVMPKHNT
jgi:hypothetical protein